MKLNLVVVAPKATAANGQNEPRDQRENRMKAFWAAPENATIHPVGRLLAQSHAGKTLAQMLVDGESLEMDSVTVDGKVLPLQDGFTLSLNNVAQVWGCPACRSAHGSGTYPSREASAKLLAGNKFFYRPSDKALFVISETCWSDYVKALGAAVPTRFTSPEEIFTGTSECCWWRCKISSTRPR